MKDEFIVKGAMATCQFGVAPAMLSNIMDNMNVYFNGKLAATSMSLGPVFQAPAFGTCNMVPNMPKPCAAVITKWDNVFMGGMKINRISSPLTKDSKGTCALGCPMCISFTTTGQLPIPAVPLPEIVKVEHQSDMNPLAGNDKALENSVTSKEGRIILPKTNGIWEDKSKRGECMWYPGLPDDTSIETKPSKTNPEGLTWKQVKDKYDFEGVEFKNKEPNFRPFSRGHVVFEQGQYTSKRNNNFSMADAMLAAQLTESKNREVTPMEVAKWREDNGYTWHEERNCQDLQKVPSIINNNIPHSGGIAAKKAKERTFKINKKTKKS
jgi:hypothetical protein